MAMFSGEMDRYGHPCFINNATKLMWEYLFNTEASSSLSCIL